jgi:AcrR family transcriptional regulator
MTSAPLQRRRPKDRRQLIEAAAAALFAERGFAGTGVADIATEVGITPGAIYRHFSSKEELLERIVLGSLSRIGDVVEAVIAGVEPDAESQLTAVVAAMLDLTQANTTFVATYLRERHRLLDDARSRRRAAEQRVIGRLQGLLREARPGITPLDVAIRLRALNGTLTSVAMRRQTVPWTRLRALFADGLAAVLLAPVEQTSAGASPEGPPRWQPPRSRREEILDAAIRLFRLHGYHGVGIDEIGEAAGIAGPTVYGNYAGKADILVDAMDRAVATMDVRTTLAVAAADSAAGGMELFAHSFVATVLAHRDIVIVATRELGALPDSERARIGRTQGDFRERWASVLAELRTELTQSEARAVLAAAFAVVEDVAIEERQGTPSADSVARLMLRFLLG